MPKSKGLTLHVNTSDGGFERAITRCHTEPIPAAGICACCSSRESLVEIRDHISISSQSHTIEVKTKTDPIGDSATIPFAYSLCRACEAVRQEHKKAMRLAFGVVCALLIAGTVYLVLTDPPRLKTHIVIVCAVAGVGGGGVYWATRKKPLGAPHTGCHIAVTGSAFASVPDVGFMGGRKDEGALEVWLDLHNEQYVRELAERIRNSPLSRLYRVE